MKVFGNDVHVFFLKPFLDDTRAVFGAAAEQDLLAKLGVSAAEIADPNAWVTLEFVEAFCTALMELHQDAALFERCGRLAFSPRYVGMLGPILRAFGSPLFAYRQLDKSMPRFNKVGSMSVHAPGGPRVTVTYRSLPDAPREKSPYVCLGRSAQLAGMTTMFNLPPAVVEHPSCMIRGDEACVYEVTWRDRPRALVSRAGAVVGVGVGVGAGLAVSAAWPVTAAFALAMGAIVWLAGRYVELGREVRARNADIFDHNDALARSARANEERYRELLEAKSEVEKKVEQRTAQLSETSTKLASTLDEVRALDRAKTDFFANVSHELRTPLTLIVAPLADLVAGREPPGGAQAALETMQRNSLRLLRLINQLLDLAKVDAGAARLARAGSDPAALVQTVVAPFLPLAKAREIVLAVDSPAQVPPVALDAEWIESALSNLLANALRFTRDRGHVTLRLADRGHEVVFEVTDDGAGIAAEDLATVFDRFAQGGDTHARRGGTGLGLAIVREAARLHGGEATVTSELGRGSTFALRIPRTAGAVVEDALPRTSAPVIRPSAAVDLPRPSADSVRPGPAPDAPLVLVVEDNDDVRAFVADVLASRYRVSVARDGREGLALATSERPAVVVTDVAMPEMDGLALTRALRGDPQTAHVPILLLTARTDAAHVLDGFDAGADDYVGKPFQARELLARVDVQIRLRRYAQELARQERLALLGTLAASVAHQVRNPLTSIRSALPLIRRRNAETLDPRSLEMFDVMIDCADRIERLTDDLLDLSRVDRASRDTFDPVDAVRTSLRLIGARVPDGVRLETHLDAKGLLDGRPADLHHALLNLLDNALRAVGEKGVVDVSATRRNGAIEIKVEDSGPGVEPALCERVFEPFYTTRAAGDGTGLGLAFARQTAVEHGGTLDVARSTHGGAAFRMTLPVR